MPIPALLILLAAVGQSAPASAAPPPPSRHWGKIFISPMGEPFRADRGSDPLATWFAAADRNHDGYLTLDEMQADADRFFAVLDTNHDGEIDPDEMSHYENVVAPEISGGQFDMAANGPRHSSRAPRENETRQGASRFGLLDLPEPVASADTNFNRGVSLEEFRQAAAHRFVALDLDHRGKLALAGLESIRPAPGPTPNKPEGAAEVDSGSVP
jgi:hypothetical protein